MTFNPVTVARPHKAPDRARMRRLLVGRTVAALATAMIPTTLTLAVVRATGSAADLGIVLACEMIPMLLCVPVAGVFADRFAPHRVVLVADLLRAAAQLGIGAELLAGIVRIPDLAALSGVTGAAVAFGTPAVRTLVAAVVAGPDRLKLNARLGVTQGIGQMAAPALAGLLILAVGAGWSSLLTGILFIFSALTMGGLNVVERIGQAATRAPFRKELSEGWTETRRHPWFLVNVIGHGVWHLAAGFLLTLGPVIAVRHLGGGSAWVVIAQSGTAGLLLGVFAAGRLPIRRPLVAVAIGAAVFALPLAAFAVPLPMAIVTASYLVAMVGLGVLSPLWETTLQRRIPQETLGRVGSFDTLISFAARPLGLAVAAPVASVIGMTAPLLVGAALVAVANLAPLLLPDVWEAPGQPTHTIGQPSEAPSDDTPSQPGEEPAGHAAGQPSGEVAGNAAGRAGEQATDQTSGEPADYATS